ncbi:MAG: peptidylprolyl isomerase [Patescibacteria group bacterium]|nr:peptidylprolyl isomerase [Patescibacteria group bacterium]
MLEHKPQQKNNNAINKSFIFVVVVITGLVMVILLAKNKNKQPNNYFEMNNDGVTESLGSPNQANNPNNINNNTQKKEDDMNNIGKPQMEINPKIQYFADIKTNLGTIKVKLYADETPITVNNFVYLVKQNFYQNTIFHRVIKDFMIQGGDPLGNGTGGPGYTFEDEKGSHKLVKGSLAMANSGPNTNGSQFFIVTADKTPWLDGKHTNFGEVVEGMKIVEQIEQSQTNQMDRPAKDIVIEDISIIEK